MSKRFSNVIHNKFANKRAKLDVKITSNVNFNTGSESQGSSVAEIARTDKPENTSKADLWDDDQDDFILLASQYAEEVEANNVPPSNGIDLTNITFERFNREVSSSTQLEVNATIPGIALDFLGEDEEIFKNLPEDFGRDAAGPSGGACKPKVAEKDPENLFKTPKLRTTGAANDDPDAHMEYLMGEMRMLRKENEKLKMENSKTFEKYQQKDGEIAMLRNELQQAKQASQSGHTSVATTADAEKLRRSLTRTIEDQKKIIAALENESALKNAFDRSTKHNSRSPVDESFAINAPKLRLLEQEFSMSTALDAFRCSTRQRAIDHDKRLTKYTIDLQNALSEILGHQGGSDKVLRHVQCIVLKGICQIQKYSLKLEFSDYTDSKYNPTIEYQHLCDFSKIEKLFEADMDLFCMEKLFPFEACAVGRRFLATVAAACSQLPLIDYLLEEIPVPNDDLNFFINEKLSFVKVLMKIVYEISYSTNIINHIVLIHSSIVLFDSLVEHIEQKQEHLTFVSDFFKILIFTRPGISGLRILVQSLLKIQSKGIASKFLELLCHSSTRVTYNLHDGYKFHQFMEESCVLQVFCSLLEATCLEVKQSSKQCQWYMDVVMELTLNTVKFVTICLGEHTKWMKEFPERSQCNCYNKLGSCLVILIHFCLNHWMMKEKVKCRKMSAIAQQGIVLLNNIFSDTSCKNVVKYGGHHVKNRLQKIYNITKHNHKYFDFGPSHKFAIATLDMNLIVFDPLCGSDSESAPNSHDDYLNEVAKTFF